MARRIGAGIAILLLGAALLLAAILVHAHASLRRLDPPLPDPAALARAPAAGDLPVRLAWADTASQPMPRAAVLERSRDPEPQAPYVMSHPAFVLEWSDGRLFVVDCGMDRASARRFGAPLTWLAGAAPIEPHAPLAERLGTDVARVAGLAFTHLHVDHVAGIVPLCAGRRRPIPLFQAPLQAERGNYTTRDARAALRRAGCTEPRRLAGGPAYAVPGFPGLTVVEAAGHTPGSQVLVAQVRDGARGVRTWVLTGDVVNHADGVRLDLPKPRLYSLLVVPESTGRLGRVRRWLAALSREPGVTLLVSHDAIRLRAAGLPEL